MIVNSKINNIYRYCTKNPEVMKQYTKEVMQLRKNISVKVESEGVIQGQNIEQALETPGIENLLNKIGAFFANPAVAETMSTSGAKIIAIGRNEENFVSQMKILSEMKANLRRAFRKSPEANTIAKDLIKEIKNPENNVVFDAISKMRKAFAPNNSESMANFRLDAANLAPEEIRGDYYKIIKDNCDYLNKPSQNIYGDLLSGLIKK